MDKELEQFIDEAARHYVNKEMAVYYRQLREMEERWHKMFTQQQLEMRDLKLTIEATASAVYQNQLRTAQIG